MLNSYLHACVPYLVDETTYRVIFVFLFLFVFTSFSYLGSSRYPNHVSKFPQVEGVSIPLEQRPWPIVPGKSTTVLSPGRQRGHRDEDGLQIRQRKMYVLVVQA